MTFEQINVIIYIQTKQTTGLQGVIKMKIKNLETMSLNEIDNALNEIDNERKIVNYNERIKENPVKSFGKLMKSKQKRNR